MKLLTPLKLGDLELPNRMIMAPLTRCRAVGQGRIPNALMAEYYAQRASAGLILTEATIVDPMGAGYFNTPGIYSEEQVEGWKLVTKEVHARGGRIFLQLWHVGRISHSIILGGAQPVSASAIAAQGHVSLLRPKEDYPVPRALTLGEIKDVVAAFHRGAEHAKAAGFDGVELHGANGYLLDQFLQDSTNHRQDEYGGPIENRARLMCEVVDAAISVWGPHRVGLHLAPRGDAHSMGDSNPLATFSYVVQQMSNRNLSFICAREHIGPDSIGPQLKKLFNGIYIANEGLNQETGEALHQNGQADAIAYGRLFIANPDLPKRFAQRAELNPWQMATFYTDGAEGYTDYPSLG